MASYTRSFKHLYAGREGDVGLIFLDKGTSVSKIQDVTSSGGAFVVGIVKLAQQVLLRLLSATGTYVYEDREASIFASDFLNGRLSTVPDIRLSLTATINSIQALFDREVLESIANGASIPLDEQLSAIVIDSIKLNGTTADVSLVVVSRNNEEFKFIAPIRIE